MRFRCSIGTFIAPSVRVRRNGRVTELTVSQRWKDVDTLRKVLFAGLCLPSMLAWLVATGVAAEPATKAVTDRGDGSRTPGVHRIPLYAEAEAGKQGDKITKATSPALPFSMRGTCSECHVYKHDYDVIKKGWHFNAMDPNVPPGRPGQPWIYVDAATGTQIPLSYRAWPGTFRPSQVGLSPFKFTAALRPADAGRRAGRGRYEG